MKTLQNKTLPAVKCNKSFEKIATGFSNKANRSCSIFNDKQNQFPKQNCALWFPLIRRKSSQDINILMKSKKEFFDD